MNTKRFLHFRPDWYQELLVPLLWRFFVVPGAGPCSLLLTACITCDVSLLYVLRSKEGRGREGEDRGLVVNSPIHERSGGTR